MVMTNLEILVMIIVFLVAGTLQTKTTMHYKFCLFCHFKLLPLFAVALTSKDNW